jgi:hypothetical protein
MSEELIAYLSRYMPISADLALALAKSAPRITWSASRIPSPWWLPPSGNGGC